jgi:hypothetical protein
MIRKAFNYDFFHKHSQSDFKVWIEGPALLIKATSLIIRAGALYSKAFFSHLENHSKNWKISTKFFLLQKVVPPKIVKI